MSSVSSRACDVILQEADIASLRKIIVVSAIASASSKKYKQLKEIADIDKGKTGIKDAQPGPFPLVVTAEARATCDHFDFEGPAILIPMVSSTGHGDASLKRIHYQEGQYAVGTILAVLRIRNDAEFSARFVYQYLSAFKDELLVSRMVGTANVSLTLNKLKEVSVPVLPIEKQREVEKLMRVCDRLEARQADAESAHAQLVEALLGSLTQARDANDFATSWQRLSQHFHTLFTTESSLDALKQTVLQLAVMGKLVPQDSSEGTADDLIGRIDAVKLRLVQESGMRTTAQDVVPQEERCLNIPDGWAYCRLGNLARFIDYRGRTPNKTDSGVPLITAKNVRLGFISREPREFIAHGDYVGWMTRGFPRVGDMLFTTEAPLGNIALVDIEEKFALAQRVICFQLHEPQTGSFLKLAIMSGIIQSQFSDAATGMTATGIKASKLKEIPIPIPPLAEQHRIVAKVDQLMALCDQLKSRLTQARQLNQQLASTLVEQAVA